MIKKCHLLQALTLTLCMLVGQGVLAKQSASIAKQTENVVTRNKTQTLPKKFTNSIGMTFVLVPQGSFVMGENAPLSEGKRDEHPAHEVTITKPFYMGQYEVTQQQWEALMGNNPSYHRGKNNPVDSVSWNDIQKFIEKLNKKERHAKYRLPTEAEWEYAARAGTATRYFFGNDASQLPQHAWIVENAGGVTHPVGQKKPNAWGIYDTSGNVREWTNDWYDDMYYRNSSSSNPKGPADGYEKAYRGGSKDGSTFPTRSSYRWRETPDTREQNLGFRLIMETE